MTQKLGSYKYCLVPKCMNTNRSTPEKYFFPVPRHKKLRKKWCNAMKRIDREPLSYKTSLHCCQDHFDIENDVENYVKYNLVGGRLILKSGVLPHQFECQLQDKGIYGSTEEKNIENIITQKEKQIDPLELVSCDLQENELSDIRNRDEENMRKVECIGVKRFRKRNYDDLKFLCKIPFKINAVETVSQI